MAYGGKIDFGIGFKVDQSSLNSLKSQLDTLSKMTDKDFLKLNPNLSNLTTANTELKEIKATIDAVSKAYNSAFDNTAGITNVSKLSNALQSIGINKIYQDFQKLGPAGIQAFNNITSQAMKTNLKLKETSGWLDKMGVTLKNTLKWSISSSAINKFTGAIQQAWGYVQHLDTSLNDIRIVTGKSADEMDKFAVSANKAAQSLGAATTDYTEAALIYYQQGLSDEESKARAETTLKAANVTGQTGRQVSEELTAVWNGYKVTAEETEEYVDKLAAVAATTASDLEELSVGMSKVASAANAMGVDVDQLNAQLSTIISVTRQAPETAGTALKTIYARIEDLKVGGEDESGVKLGDVSATLDKVGISIFDTQGELRDLGEVIEEVAGKWDTWTDAQQNAIAQAMAGKRQYNNLLALFENWDMYESALETSKNATGTLQKQQDIYMESTSAHLQQLKTEWEDLYDSLLSTDDINGVLDGFTSILDKVGKFTDAVGGGKGVLLGLGSVATHVFRKQFAQELTNVTQHMFNLINNTQQYNGLLAKIHQFDSQNVKSNQLKTEIQLTKELMGYAKNLTQEELKQRLAEIDVITAKQGEVDVQKEVNKKLEEGIEIYSKLQQKVAMKGNTAEVKTNAQQAQGFKVGDNTTAAKQVIQNQLNKNTTVETTLKSYNETVNKIIKERKNLEKAYNDLSTAIADNDVNKIKKAQGNIDKYKESLKDLENTAKNTQHELKEGIISYGEYDADKVKKVNGELEKTEKYIHSLATGNEHVDIDKDFKNTNNEVTKLNNSLKDMTAEAKAGLSTMAQQLDEADSKTKSLEEEVVKLTQDYNENLESASIQKFSESVMGVFEGASQIGFALSSIQGLFDTLENEDLTVTEKIGQSLTSISMIVTGLITGIPKLITSIQAVHSSFSNFSPIVQQAKLALLNYGSAQDVVSMAKSAYLAASPAELAVLEQETNLHLQDANAINADNAALVLNTLAKEGNTTATAALNTQGLIQKAIIGSLTRIWTEFTAVLAANPFTAAIIGLTLLTTAATKFILHIQKINDEQAKISAENFVTVKQTDLDTLSDYADKVDELVNKFDELSEKYESQEISLPNLRSEIYDLSKAYNVQIDAIDILTASYEELDSTLKSVQNNAKEAQNSANKALIDAKRNSLIATSTASMSSNRTVWKDVIKGSVSNANMSQAIYNETGLDVMDSGGTINWDIFYNATQEQQGIITNILEDYEAYNSRAEDALNAIRENQQTWNEIQTTEQQFKEDTAQTILDNIIADNQITNVTDYNKVKEKLVNQIVEELDISYEEALKLAEDKLNSQSDIIKVNASIELSGQLKDSYSLSEEELGNKIAGLSQSDITFLSENINLAKAYDRLDEFLSAYEDVRKALQQKDNMLNIQAVITNADGSEFKAEDIEKLFEDENFANDIGFTREEFEKQTYEEQMSNLLQYYYKANELESEYERNKKQALLDEQQARYDALATDKETLVSIKDEVLSTYQGVTETALSEGFQNQINNTLTLAKETLVNSLGDLYENINPEDIIQKFASDGIQSLTTEEQTYITYLESQLGLTEQDIKLMANQKSAYKDFESQLEKTGKETGDYAELVEDLEKQLSEVEGVISDIDLSDIDWSSFGDGAEQLLEATSSGIDDVQSAYSSLTSVMKDYNETSVLSMDNLQTLLNMDTEYLSALQIENGQMSLNEESLKQIALARLDEAEAEAYMQAMAELNDEARRREIESASQAKTSLENLGGAATSAAEAARNGIDAWNDYWAAALHTNNVDNDAYAQQVGDALRTKLNAIDAVRQQILSGNFGTTMSGTSSSSSSSSSSSNEPDTEEYLEEEVDLYREINAELDEIESKLSRIQETEDHSWGASMQEALEAENKLLDDQLAKLEEKKQIQLDDLATQKATLESYGIGVSADGSSVTDTSALTDLYTTYNSMVDKYNAMSKDEQDSYKDQLDNQKDLIDDVEDAIEDYEDTYSDYQSTLDDLLDAHYAEIENAVKSFNNMIDVHLELKDAEQEWNDFWEEVVEDVDDTDFGGKIAASMKQLTTLVGLGGDTSNSSIGMLTAHVNETVGEVWKQINNADNGGQGSLFGDDTALSKETLTDYRDKLMDALTTAKGEVDEISENYLSMLDSAQDLLDEQVAGWEAIGDHIEHNVELIKLVSGEKSFEALDKQYQLQYENNLELIETQKQGADFWSAQIQRYQTLLATTDESSIEWDTYSEALDKATENYRNAVEDLDSTLEDTLKELDTLRTNKVNGVMDELDKSMSGGFGLDTLEEEWKMIDDHSSKYLDNVERAYSMEEYADILQDAASATGLTAENQAKINQFMEEELDKLNKKEKLTQYDIDESKARLEILKQQIALEDAQANKSSMRLRRDSQGNYTYQYVGNQDAVDDAEKGGLTARKEWYQLVKKQYKDTTDWILNLEKEQKQLLTEIDTAEKNGETERLEILKQMYDRNLHDIEDAYRETEKNKRDLVDGTAKFFAQVENASVLPQSAATVRTLVNQWVNNEDSFVKAVTNGIVELESIQEEYVDKTQKALAKAGVGYQDLYKKGIDPTTKSLQDLTDSNEELGEKLDETNNKLTTQEENLRAAEAAYKALKEAAVDAITKANEALETLAETAVKTKTTVEEATNVNSNANVNTSTSTSSTDSGSTGTNIGNTSAGTAKTNTHGYRVYTDPSGVAGKYYATDLQGHLIGNLKFVDLDTIINWLIQHGYHKSDGTWNVSKSVREFKSGGYTGEWNNGSEESNGRLAFLHQKELVLNESDTANILQAVNAVRDLVSSSANTRGIADKLVAAGNMSAQVLAQVGSGILQGLANIVTTNQDNSYRNTTINADFSGVRSADAIYQALRELESYGDQQSYSSAPSANVGY